MSELIIAMRKAILLLLLIGSLTTVKAQQSKWGLSFTPAFVTISSVRYGLQAGAEYRINDRASLLTEVAVPVGNGNDPYAANTQYFRIKPKVRYLLSNRESTFRFYAGFQGSYSFRKWKVTREGVYFNHKLRDTAIRYNSATITTPVFTTSAQIGTLIHIGSNFCLDVFTGLGVRVIDTKYSNVENPAKDIYFRSFCKIFPSPDPAYWINGTLTRFHANMGVRFLYRF